MTEFRFDGAQQFQLDAIAAVTGLLDGQGHIGATLVPAAGTTVVPNALDLSDEQVLENLVQVQTSAGIKPDAALGMIEQTVDLYDGKGQVRFPNFSVEMETGTGKTYVYLRTILALAGRYGLTKFIIVVPSVAVREGVLKTIRQTKKHFAELHSLPPFHSSVYAAQPGQVRSFAASNAVEIMVMTIDAFSREQNVIRKGQEGNAPVIHLLQAVRPVLILDEPQNMESEGRVAALAALNPLFALRYSATHKNAYSLVYRLSPYDAYRQAASEGAQARSAPQERLGNHPRRPRIAADRRQQRAGKTGLLQGAGQIVGNMPAPGHEQRQAQRPVPGAPGGIGDMGRLFDKADAQIEKPQAFAHRTRHSRRRQRRPRGAARAMRG